MKSKLYHYSILFISILMSSCASSPKEKSTIFFEDDFGVSSQGEYVENVIHLPEPTGLGIQWKVLPGGHLPTKWVMADEVAPENPFKGMWVIPADSGYMEQGGRSKNSVLYINTPIPEGTKNFDIAFRQYRNDNDDIMFILGADKPRWDVEHEFGYMTQVPGTDSTTVDAYVSGVLGERLVPGAAKKQEWASHRIEVRNKQVAWYQDDQLMIEGEWQGNTHGYFGIRQRYERGTRYDDVMIIII